MLELTWREIKINTTKTRWEIGVILLLVSTRKVKYSPWNGKYQENEM